MDTHKKDKPLKQGEPKEIKGETPNKEPPTKADKDKKESKKEEQTTIETK